MLNKKERTFIKENIDRLSVEEMAKSLGINPKKLKKEIHKMNSQKTHEPKIKKKAYTPGSISHKNRKIIIICTFFIFVATFLVYVNTLGNNFIWDDEYLILNNSQIKSFSHFWNIFKTYVGFGSENINTFYRPLQELSNMIDYFMWGSDPLGFHLTNIISHSLTAALVFLFIFYISGNIPIAFFAGLLFGIHPVNTEAVAYIAGRADSLYSIFFLLSFIFFIRYINRVLKHKKSIHLIVLSNIFFILSLLSKEVSVVLPLLLLTYLFILIKNSTSKETFKPLKNLWISYAIIVFIYAILRFTVLNFFDMAPPMLSIKIPFINRMLTFFKVIVVYIKLLIVPTGLHMERAMRITRYIYEPDALLSLFVFLGIIGTGVIFLRINRIISFFIFWFFINLLPMSNIYPINSFIAEHWIYMASLGYYVFVGFGVYTIYLKVRQNLPARFILLGLTGSVFLIYSFMTVERNKDWKDEISFFESTLKYRPTNARLYLNLGNTYYEKKEYNNAIKQYQKVLELDPNDQAALGNIGAVYLNKGDFKKAKEYIKKALLINQKNPTNHNNLAKIYYEEGKYKDAIAELKIAVKELPQFYQAWNLLGRIYIKEQNPKAAEEAFEKSLQIMPDQEIVKKSLKILQQSK